DTDRTPNEWISLVSQPVFQLTVVEDGRREPTYTEYPYPVIYPDMLPPDYPALLSLFLNVIAIVWNIRFCAWLALLPLFSSFVLIRFNEIDYMQYVVSTVFQILSYIRVFCFSSM
ncbi:hypothetical protein WA538_003846, partial [Blastocystis sp. DL]